jgi:hypothetical protein
MISLLFAIGVHDVEEFIEVVGLVTTPAIRFQYIKERYEPFRLR